MAAELPRAVALRRLTEMQRDHCTLDGDLAFDVLLDAVEHPTADMLRAGANALAQAVPEVGERDRRLIASVVWRAMWEVIE